MSRRKIRHFCEYAIFRIFVAFVQIIPTRASVRMAHGLAKFTCRLPNRLSRYNVAAENLRNAFGEDFPQSKIDDLFYRMWVHLFRMVVEIIHLPNKLRLYNCSEFMSFRNRDECVRAMCAGRPVITMGGHFGNWEMANCAFGWFGFPMGVVARDLDNPWLHNWFERFRRHTGHRLISKKGGGGDMMAYLMQGGSLALLGDQDAGYKGIYVDFFGKPASTFKSIALLAMQHNAVICVGYARRLEDDFENCRWVRYEIGCEGIIDPQELENESDVVRIITQTYTDAIERIVRLSPEQYFWVHRRWKTVKGSRVRKKKRKAPIAA